MAPPDKPNANIPDTDAAYLGRGWAHPVRWRSGDSRFFAGNIGEEEEAVELSALRTLLADATPFETKEPTEGPSTPDAAPPEKGSTKGRDKSTALSPRPQHDLDFGAEMAEGEEDVRQAIFLLLETIIGERVMRPEYGCDLNRFVFAPINTETKHNIAQSVRRALILWEKRIRNITVEVTESTVQEGRLDVELTFELETHRMRQNLVYPFCILHPEGG